MARETDDSKTVTRKPDDAVGSRDDGRTGQGQTAQQAAITGMGGGGAASDRKPVPKGGEPGRAPPTPGGSSSGQSDQQASRGDKAGEPVAAGRYKVDREQGS